MVLVLWILTLLSLMAGSFVLTMRRESGVTIALKHNAEAIAVSESALVLAEYMLQLPDQTQRWLVDGSIYQIIRRDISVTRIRIVSETGKIDINTANPNLLAAVIKTVTSDKFAEQKLLNSILDWRDEDDDPRMQGAEKKEYQDAGLSYLPTNKPFQSLEELQMVLGMNQAIFTQIQPWITIYSGQSDVNVQEALPDVLNIINNDTDYKPATPAATNQGTAANPQPAAGQNNGDPALAANRIYTIAVEVKMEDGASAALEAVIKLQSQDPGQPPVQILDWKQNQLTRSLFADDMNTRLITVQDEFTNNN